MEDRVAVSSGYRAASRTKLARTQCRCSADNIGCDGLAAGREDITRTALQMTDDAKKNRGRPKGPVGRVQMYQLVEFKCIDALGDMDNAA